MILALLLLSIYPFPGPGKTSGGGGGYTGPGDVITSNAISWWGLRAYSSATRGNKLANVCDAADAHCVDMLSDATTGNAIIPSSNPDCTSSGCTVKTLYDLTGNMACAGPCDVTQATIANRPMLTVNCINTTLSCFTWTSSSQLLQSANPITSGGAQPFSASYVAERTTFTSIYNGVAGIASGAVGVGFDTTANKANIYAGLVGTQAASDGAFHAVQFLFSTTASIVDVDGSSATVSAGAADLQGSSPFRVGNGGSSAENTKSVEMGWFSVDKSANFSALNSNQHAYWGF